MVLTRMDDLSNIFPSTESLVNMGNFLVFIYYNNLISVILRRVELLLWCIISVTPGEKVTSRSPESYIIEQYFSSSNVSCTRVITGTCPCHLQRFFCLSVRSGQLHPTNPSFQSFTHYPTNYKRLFYLIVHWSESGRQTRSKKAQNILGMHL